jgi:hypothetical protein
LKNPGKKFFIKKNASTIANPENADKNKQSWTQREQRVGRVRNGRLLLDPWTQKPSFFTRKYLVAVPGLKN